jgi:hypothetical protein
MTALNKAMRFSLVAVVLAFVGQASASRAAAIDICRSYGYVPRTHDYAACRMDARHYWTAGPCGDSRFAAVHRRYCHLIPELDF